jgi:hypothetical protein
VLIKHLQYKTISPPSLSFFLLAKYYIIGQVQKKKDKENKDFLRRFNITYAVLNKYYTKTDLSLFYATALILNPSCYTRYIKVYWPKKYTRLALIGVKKL